METETKITAEAGSFQTVKQIIGPQDTNERHIAIAFLLILTLVGVWYITKRVGAEWDWIPSVCNNTCGAILGFLTGKATAKLEQK